MKEVRYLKKRIFKGVATAIVTPFNQDGSINYGSFKNLIEFQINSGVDAIVVCGTTGEASTLSYTEHLNTISFCCEQVNGRVPVIAGSGSNDTEHAVSQSKKCCEIGVDGLLVVTPYYNKTSQEGLTKHYFKIADAVDAPIILYNVPSRTGMNILPATYKRLSEHQNIVATKEASGNITQIAKIFELCDNNLYVYSGNDDQILPILSLGGQGVISVASNILPKEIREICRSYFAKDTERSASLQVKFMSIIEALFCEVNPMPVKYALNLMKFDVGDCRLPLTSISKESVSLILKELKKHHLISDDSV